MKIVRLLVLLVCFVFLTGCGTKVITYSFGYTENTRFNPDEKVILENIVFSEVSESTNLDLAVFELIGESESYLIDYALSLAQDTSTGVIYNIDHKTRNLLSINKLLLDEIIFGEIIPWSEADELFPRLGKGVVRDLETGIYFRVQRRGGTNHVDVQPLTKQDTESMFNAYSGSWSWDRRAVIVQSGGRYIAGSMNGMPHGAGAIQDNNFNGHSCIHFSGSITHGNDKLDFAHQLMVKKAGGLFFDTLMEMPPEDILRAFIILSTQEQVHYLQYILRDFAEDTSFFSNMQSVHLGPIVRAEDEADYVKLEVETMYYSYNIRHEEVLTFDLYKEPWDLTWKIKFVN